MAFTVTGPTAVGSSGQEMKICVTPANGEKIRDLHFGAGDLPDGAAVTVTPEPAVGWSADVFAGKVNLFGGPDGELPEGQETCFTVKLPAPANPGDPSYKWDSTNQNVLLSTDGNHTADSTIGTAPAKAWVPKKVQVSVGGIAGIRGDSSTGSRADMYGDSGSDTAQAVTKAAVAGAAVVVLLAVGWYARRRLL